MSSAARFRHLQLLCMDIDGNDRICSGKCRKLHDRKPDTAGAENHHGLSDLHPGVVVDYASGGRHSTSE